MEDAGRKLYNRLSQVYGGESGADWIMAEDKKGVDRNGEGSGTQSGAEGTAGAGGGGGLPLSPLQREVLAFIRGWHQVPEIQEVLWCHGVNLGETAEYLLYDPVLAVLRRCEEDRAL